MKYDILRSIIREILEEMQSNPRVADQLKSPKSKQRGAKKQTQVQDEEDEDEDEVDEAMAIGAGAIAGFTGPLGASNLDMGHDHAVAGKNVKKRKKSFVRWK